MGSEYYMRIRGRVLGPYGEEKMQSLARRGQLSRMHEISTDGVSWSRASAFPQLFAGAPMELATTAPAAASGSQGNVQSSGNDAPAASGPAKTQAQWFYTSGGMQRGPVDYSQLQLLVGTGQLGSQDQVWSEGMPGWVSASTIPGVGQNGSSNSRFVNTEDGTGNLKLPDIVVKSAVGSRPWALMVAIVIDLLAIMILVGSFRWLIVGARLGSADIVGTAICIGINAIVWIVGAMLLHIYCRRLSALLYGKNMALLERAHDALRAFWIFSAIYLIVLVAFSTVVAVYLFAVGVTWPRIPI